MSRLPAEPALVGRDHEIEQLTQHLQSAFNGKGTTVFVSGEAGVGKTRLINEFLKLAKKRGAKIFSGWCLGEANIAYFPFREAFDTCASTIGDEKLRSIVTKHLEITGWLSGREPAQELKPRELFSTPEIERDRTFEAAVKVLLRLSAHEPLILFLDDLHWADPLSLALLHYLSRKCRNSRLLIIGTYRLEELVRTMEERPHPLEETMFLMSREDLLAKMELSRLKRNYLPQFLRSIFRSSFGGQFEDRLFEETEGNPLFAIETLNMLVDEGYLSEKDEGWALTAPMEKIGIPSKVHEVITRRISRLGREERKLLDVAAVCGHSFTADMLSEALLLDIADVLQALVELEHRHRLVRSVDSAFEFTHHKVREVIYGNMPAELRRVYHLKIAGWLEQVLTGKITDGYMANMVLHSVEGEAPEKAFEYLLKLGEKAVDIYANTQAIDYLNKALEVAQETFGLDASENLGKIYKLRGRAWLGQGETSKAISDFDLLLQNATSICDESMITEAHYWIGCAMVWAKKRDEAILHLTRATEMARKTGNKLIEGRSLGELYWPLMGSLNTIEEGRMRLEESLRTCREVGDKVTEARNLWSLGAYHNWKGEFNQAEETLNRASALTEEVGDSLHKISTLFALSLVQAGKGEYNRAISTIQTCLQLSKDSGIVHFVPRALNVLGWIYHDLSSIELALKHNKEALKTARIHQESVGVGSPQPACLVNLGMNYLCKNEFESAEKCFEEAGSVIHLHLWVGWRFETRILLGLGEISLAKGDYAQALKSAEDSLAISEKAGAKKYVAKGLKLKAEVLAKMGRTMEAIEFMEDAVELAQQVGNPPLLWQIHYSFGLLEEKNGDTRKANEHYAKAMALIEAVASQLNDVVIKSNLLTSENTRAIRDAYARTTLTHEMAAVPSKVTEGEAFESVNVRASISVPEEFVLGEEFEVKLDLANVGNEAVLLVSIEGIVPRRCKVLRVPSRCALEGASLNMRSRRLDPRSVESVSVWVQMADAAVVRLSPRVVYVDELGNFRTTRVEEAKILPVIEFKSKVAQAVFNYLVGAFVEDREKRRLSVDRSGWRSFPKIIKGAGVPRRSLYGAGGRFGHGLSELQRNGLVDLETFSGERGRGGHILRVKIHHKKELVRKYVKEKAPDLSI